MLYEDNYLAHFGIKGQKWGIRRYQNEDGTLTPEGKRRYYEQYKNEADLYEKQVKRFDTQLKDLKKNGYKAKSYFDDDELGDAIVKEYGKKAADEYLKRTILDVSTSLAMEKHNARYKKDMASFFFNTEKIKIDDVLNASENSIKRMGKKEHVDDKSIKIVAQGRKDQELNTWKNKYKLK